MLGDRRHEVKQPPVKELTQVFVYGTLKPGESNYLTYCAPMVLVARRAIALGELFALPLGYPAMILGKSPIQGFLLSFPNVEILSYLDRLEGYDANQPPEENEYHRQQIETFDLTFASLGLAWAYLMTPAQINSYGGVLLPQGCWSG